MPGGRPPKPTHLKLVTGNPGRRPLNKQDVARAMVPKRALPIAPAHLSVDAQKAWARFLKLLGGLGVLEASDALALERMCEIYADIIGAQAALEMRGSRTYETITVAGGRQVKVYPEVAILADADRRFRSYLIEFGLTPAARTKVGQANRGDKDGSDPLDGYFV